MRLVVKIFGLEYLGFRCARIGRMGKRLTGFDYSRPYYYMVTLKALPHAAPFSEIVAPGTCQGNPITFAMVNCIRHFHQGCQAIAPIECFTIMPDHLHLLIRIRELPASEQHHRLRLETIVSLLTQALTGRYTSVTQRDEAVFSTDWHDWIIASKGQLAAFTRYIRENPMRHWLRQEHRQYFNGVRQLRFAGRDWYAYGNTALLKLPHIAPFRCSRQWQPNDSNWRSALAIAERLGPGSAGVSTFLSPCEKVCGNAIYQAGGAFIVLTPQGFPERWHPSRTKEQLCADGRMLFLSLWEPSTAQLDRATLYQRCHEMGDLMLEHHQKS